MDYVYVLRISDGTGYFSDAVIRQHDQVNLQEKDGFGLTVLGGYSP